MRRLAAFAAAGLFCLPVAAQTFNLNSIIDAVKNVARSQTVASMPEAEEIAAGKDIAAGMIGKYRLVRDEKLQRYLNAVGLWVAMQSERAALPWRFAAVESDQINAFAVPGGTVLLTTGILRSVTNEAELACVLGHEIGHVVRKHHLALLQKDILVQTGSGLLAEQAGQRGGVAADVKKFLVTEGGEIFARSLDRNSERDADGDGVLLAARAGYDAGACLSFMRRLAALKQGAGTLDALYKTHPQAADRAIDVDRAIAALDGAAPGSGKRPQLPFKLPGPDPR